MPETFGKQDQWEEYSREELMSVAPALIYLARRTEQKKEENATTDSSDRPNKS